MQDKISKTHKDSLSCPRFEKYLSPLGSRYAGKEMSGLFSPKTKYSIWRRLWVALAVAEKELGLSISDAQLEELKSNVDIINFEAADRYEKELNHDVMAHIHAYGDLCPKARGIIHLGATSCYVTDNGDLIQIDQALSLIHKKLKKTIATLASFARQYKGLACLGMTHLQPAQLTTVGKRACLWLQDFWLDLQELDYRRENLLFLGVKGATGTQASFAALFNGDFEKVRRLDIRVSELMGFKRLFPISGQTYTRKQDALVMQALSGIGASAHKMATDLRLLAAFREIEEPFSNRQVGSSAMPHKRNPILSERICALSRYLISLADNPQYTHATQWLERSLDDSANRRLCIPEAFLTADAILQLIIQIGEGLVVNAGVINQRVREELPFLAGENILMTCVKRGGDRQVLHERLRFHSHEASKLIKAKGTPNDLLKRVTEDTAFSLTSNEIEEIFDVSKFIGLAEVQVDEFLKMIQ